MIVIENVNLILSVIYLILAIINICGGVSIDEPSIFGMTIGTLFLCLAQVVEDGSKIKFLMNFLGMGAIIIIPLLNYSTELIKYSDSNTWMLLSLSITFLSNFIAKVNDEKKQNEIKKQELNKNCKDLLNLIEESTNIIANKSK